MPPPAAATARSLVPAPPALINPAAFVAMARPINPTARATFLFVILLLCKLCCLSRRMCTERVTLVLHQQDHFGFVAQQASTRLNTLFHTQHNVTTIIYKQPRKSSNEKLLLVLDIPPRGFMGKVLFVDYMRSIPKQMHQVCHVRTVALHLPVKRRCTERVWFVLPHAPPSSTQLTYRTTALGSMLA